MGYLSLTYTLIGMDCMIVQDFFWYFFYKFWLCLSERVTGSRFKKKKNCVGFL